MYDWLKNKIRCMIDWKIKLDVWLKTQIIGLGQSKFKFDTWLTESKML